MFKPYQPVKRPGSRRIFGFFYRDQGDTIQYISFNATVVSIPKSKVCAATEEEYLEDRRRRYARVAELNRRANP